MQQLLTQLLMLARVENLTELGDAGPLHLAEVAEQALREASEHAGARSSCSRSTTTAMTWSAAVTRLLAFSSQNLLDNALRYAPEQGQVMVRVAGHAERVSLEVNDDGAGFATNDTARLAERFHRPEGSVGEGSGLGLSIAHAIAGLHRGELEFGRSELGGARVSFSLPR